ncbi:MAG: PQQ-binding-like beta-propeller repeat protein [Planctomycetota bacterium]|nr:PQQ-binding-like beta-propeller repeat protein [Planctomycetota bacterium]
MSAFLAVAVARPALAGDWPTYKHDLRRTSFAAEELALPLRLAWKYVSPQAPSPAWPDTFWLLNRTDFDYAPHPVIASGIVCFGSTSDDTVRALDIATGQEKWHYIAGGPVRIAPQIEAGKVYFGADDGYVTCLDAATGKVVWRFFAAPRDERNIGNHRMISRWPVRTGVLVADGVVYAAAGMLNMEGVFIYALKADTGQVVWCNDTTGFMSVGIVDYPESADPRKETVGGHNGEFAASGAVGANPQGPMLLSGDTLIIPNANSSSVSLDRRNGHRIAVGAGSGTWLTIDRQTVYSMTRHHEDVLSIVPSPLGAGGKSKPWGVPHVPQVRIMNPKLGYIHDKTKVSAIVHEGKLYAHRAYGLALAGGVIVKGMDGAIYAQDADTERELWRATVEGEAREIAVADGRVYLGTTTGAIYCFVPASRNDTTPALVIDPASKITAAPAPAPPPAAAPLIEKLRRAGMDRGFALLLGDADGQFARALAAQTQLRVVSVVADDSPDERTASALREQLLAQTTWGGSRIQVVGLAKLDRLPFAQFFANAVIVVGPVAGLSGKELYRVLRPCGGHLFTPGLGAAEAAALMKATGATDAEQRVEGEVPCVVRGKLPGALDWDSSQREHVDVDQRVKWPLRPLWFGGPATAQIHGFSAGSDVTIANGRYFVEGEQSITAVDAYNGELLWTHPLPRTTPDACMLDGVIHRTTEPIVAPIARYENARNVTADDSYVYLRMGPAYFRAFGDAVSNDLGEAVKIAGKGDGVIQLDARTGEQVALAAPFNPPAAISLKGVQKWSLQVDPRRSGVVALESTDRGPLLTLTTKDPLVTKLDSWDLYFDFRAPAARAGLYERGAFNIHVVVAQNKETPPAWTPGAGPAVPKIEVAGTREPDGTKTTVIIPWAELEKLTGGKPASFGFGAAMNLHDGGADEPIARRRLFCDWTADGLNNGWACVVLDPSAAPAPGSRPAVYIDNMKRGSAVHDPGDFIGPARAAFRVHPLTGELGPKMFRLGGCGGRSNSQELRSGSQSIYDFTDDSGMRPMGGVKARCSTPQSAALGLLIISEENGHCECPFPLRTTMVLAPAERRLQEDWAFYFDRPADTRVRQASINLGAPGDRRDDAGTLWLGYPRIPAEKSRAFPVPAASQNALGSNGVWLRVLSAVMQVPLEIECFGGPNAYKPQEDMSVYYGWFSVWTPGMRYRDLGPYRVNADHVEIRNTDRPWIYASGYRGIQKATLKLNLMPPLASMPIDKAPPFDGKRANAPWTGEPQALLPFTQTKVYLRHDAENLYIAARRPSVVDRLGFVSRWTAGTKGEDAPVWQDDSFEVFLSDADGKAAVHLGVSASGARYDALGKGVEKEDAAWNGVWRSAVLADQSAKAIEAGSGSKNPVPKDQTFIAMDPKTKIRPDDIDATNAIPLEAPAKGKPANPAAEELPLVIEMAIPWKSLEAAGIRRESLAINFQTNQRDTSGMPATSPGTMQSGRSQTASEALTFLGITGRQQCLNFAPIGLGSPAKSPLKNYTVRLHFAELDDAKPGQRVFDVKLQEQVALKAFDIVKEAGGPRTALVKEIKGVAAGDTLTVEFIPAAAEVTAANAPTLCALELVEEGFTPPAIAKADDKPSGP